MVDEHSFALVLVVAGAIGMLALISDQVTAWLRVPAPLLFLLGAAGASEVIPGIVVPRAEVVQHTVTIALLFILFDGGMRIGWSRFRSAAAPIAAVGLLGTVLTIAAAAAFLWSTTDLSGFHSALIATAISPTDPAVVFSVLRGRDIAGRSGTILEGESGANDPVGIALMTSLLAAGGLTVHGDLDILRTFALQMFVGAGIGMVGGIALLLVLRHISLPTAGLYPVRTIAAIALTFGCATLAHGSGFLAVFVAGIAVGDLEHQDNRATRAFHGTLANVGEIAAFVVLGLTVDLGQLTHLDTWAPGVALAVVVALLIRPLLVGICLAPARIAGRERLLVLFAGLKGAVPLLLGTLILTKNVPVADRMYGIIVVAVVLSVGVQGTLTPVLARRLHLLTE